MSDELQIEYVDRALDASVRSELESDENLVLKVKPDSDAIALTLLPFPIIWLTGMFLYSVGTLQTTNDFSQALSGSILVLVLVAVLGLIEIIAVPQQAKRTVFVVTDRRVFSLKLKGKFGYAGMDDYSIVSRKLVRSEKNTMFFYLAITVPIQIILCLLVLDVVRSILTHSTPFTMGGFAFIMGGLVFRWYQDLRYPLPSLRECPRTFYFINEYLATVESAPYDQIDKAVFHKNRSGFGDIFLLVAGKGCLRLKCLPDAKALFEKIEEQRKSASSKPIFERRIEEEETESNDTEKQIDNQQIDRFIEEVERLVESQSKDPGDAKNNGLSAGPKKEEPEGDSPKDETDKSAKETGEDTSIEDEKTKGV